MFTHGAHGFFVVPSYSKQDWKTSGIKNPENPEINDFVNIRPSEQKWV